MLMDYETYVCLAGPSIDMDVDVVGIKGVLLELGHQTL
jgi:hypothetical protein